MIAHRRAQDRSKRGVSLVEMLIVVALMALVAAGVAVAVLPHWITSKKKTAETNARVVRQAVKTWWLDRETSTCPSFDELVSTGNLDRGSARADPWGSPWLIQCTDSHDVSVTSLGPDKLAGTADDIHAPPS